MDRVVLGLIATAWLGGIWPIFGDDPLESSFPLEAKGDIHFQVDAVFFLEDGEPAVEVDLAIPDSGLGTDHDSLHLRITTEMLDSSGNGRVSYATEMTIPVGTTTGGDERFPVPGRWIRLYPRWHPGTAGLRVIVEDQIRQKPGLADRARGKFRQGEAAARLALPLPEEIGQAPMSGILLAWDQTPKEKHTTGGPGLRSVRSRLQPNPYRYYGLYQPILTAYWESYLSGSADSGEDVGDGTWEAVYRIRSIPEEKIVLESRETIMTAPEARWHLKRFDVSELATGSYVLEIALVANDSIAPSSSFRTESRFQVLWEQDKWTLDEGQMLTYARLLLPSVEYERFVLLGRGEKAAYLREFWNRHSPSTPGEENELEQVFLARVAYSNDQFGGYRAGSLSDRGRVYIRYGPPDEISENLNPQDEELLWNILPQEITETGDPFDRTGRETRRRSPLDNRAYVIWDYTVRGDPLIEDYVHPGMQTGLKFIFVDELGYGDFVLVYTSLVGGLQ